MSGPRTLDGTKAYFIARAWCYRCQHDHRWEEPCEMGPPPGFCQVCRAPVLRRKGSRYCSILCSRRADYAAEKARREVAV